MGSVTLTGEARADVVGPPEGLRMPARSKVSVAGDLLREKCKGRVHRVRKDLRRRMNHKMVARAHHVAGGELLTAAVTEYSDEP